MLNGPHSATETALISSTENFAELMTAVATFFKPVVTAIHVGIPLSARWDPSALVPTPAFLYSYSTGNP